MASLILIHHRLLVYHHCTRIASERTLAGCFVLSVYFQFFFVSISITVRCDRSR